jgi:hypothetical protein
VICTHCQASVPEESAFCLRCGARLAPLARVAPVNGGKAHAAPTAVRAPGRPAVTRQAAVEPARPAAGRGGKDAYALSFKPLADERLRYRVARWLCEVAPAHHVGEVQQGLAAGGFATFLALTAAEADAARQRIEALGAHPALWQLKPAGAALDALLPERPRRPARAREEWTTQKKFAAVAIGLAMMFVFGAVAWYLFAVAPPRVDPVTRTVPTIGGQQ